MRKFSKQTIDLMGAYASGYSYGRAGLELNQLWDEEEEGHMWEVLGHSYGIEDLKMFGKLEGKVYDAHH
jgi:hypothetical protein